jgi:rhodanese-related sulfurtransferase
MSWTTIFFAGAAAALFLIWKYSGNVSAGKAKALLQQGALVVDVRSPGEFAAGHLRGAINLPLDRIAAAHPLPGGLQDKQRVILLHCQGGMRSRQAKSLLRSMGYANAFNLGSYQRAAGIVRNK